jgi:hypothetical protein
VGGSEMSQGVRSVNAVLDTEPQSPSLEAALAVFERQLHRLDVDAMSGAHAARLLGRLARLRHMFDATMSSLSARAIAEQHHEHVGERSEASWLAKTTGTSERRARSAIRTQQQLAHLPDVGEALRRGDISFEQAAIIGNGARGDAVVAGELLATAKQAPVEIVERRIREINASRTDLAERERLRRTQFVSIRTTADSMLRGEFRLFPEHAAALIEAYRNATGATSYERAESFADLLGASGGKDTKVVFHLDVAPDGSGGFVVDDKCELRGVGPMSSHAVDDVFETASKALIGTVKNKLTWFSEEDRRSTTRPLPQYVRRAVLARSYDRCTVDDCTSSADDVDHITARCNAGINDLENLQALCRPHHNAKTRRDAPWTADEIYGRERAGPKNVNDTS